MRGMLVDLFPSIDIPVVAVVWTYPGLSAEDMEKRVVLYSERGLSSVVNGIQRIESQSIPGIGLEKIYFQPGTDIGNAIAQIASSSSTSLRRMPRGIQPPYILQSNASNVPVAQLTMTSETMSEEKIADYGQNFLRLRLFTIPGLSTPAPYGGKTREITIDVDPAKLAAKGLSANDVVTAVNNSNVFIPAGTARLGDREYNVSLNSSPSAVSEFSAIPVKVVNGAPVTVGDVATVADGYADQTNIVRVDGHRGAYLSILKKADASTLAVVDATKDLLPTLRAIAPHGLDLRLDFDQSTFVRGVGAERGARGVHRGASRVADDPDVPRQLAQRGRSGRLDPTGIACSVDRAEADRKFVQHHDAGWTVAIDRTSRRHGDDHGGEHSPQPGDGETAHRRDLDGAAQISLPVIMATLAICIVFFPVLLLEGPARFLFVPMALAVVIAMLAAWLLSRTLVKTLSRMLLAGERAHGHGHDAELDSPHASGLSRFSRCASTERATGSSPVSRIVTPRHSARSSNTGARRWAAAALLALVSFMLLPIVGTGLLPERPTPG